MPPSGFSREAARGAVQFIGACYRDLQKEVESGKHASTKEAIDFELSSIERALLKIHINENGELEERQEE
jgi:hypothetical protein